MEHNLAESTRAWQLALLPALWGAGVAVAVFALLGYLSCRVLRQLPDFPEKQSMVRGSVWSAPAFAGLCVVTFAVTSLGAGVGLPMAALCLGKALFWAGFAWLCWRFRPETEGMFRGVTYWLRYRKRGLEAFRLDYLSAREKSRRYYRILAWWWPILIAVWLVFGVFGYIEMDRPLLAMMTEERLGAELAAQLGDPRVIEVVPMRYLFEGPLYPLHVNVRPTTTPQQATQLAERMKQVLAQRGEENAWRIVVRPEHGHTLARTIYVQTGMTLPNGIERQQPRPRKW